MARIYEATTFRSLNDPQITIEYDVTKQFTLGVDASGNVVLKSLTQDADLFIKVMDGAVETTMIHFDASVPRIILPNQVEITSTDLHGSIILSDSGGDMQIHSNNDLYIKGDFLFVQLNTDMRIGSATNRCNISGTGGLSFWGSGGLASLKATTQNVTTTPTNLTGTNSIIHSDATAGNKVLNLPDISTRDGLIFIITKIDAGANTVTVKAFDEADGTDTIQGANSVVLNNQYDTLFIVGDASANTWYKIGGNV